MALTNASMRGTKPKETAWVVLPLSEHVQADTPEQALQRAMYSVGHERCGMVLNDVTADPIEGGDAFVVNYGWRPKE